MAMETVLNPCAVELTDDERERILSIVCSNTDDDELSQKCSAVRYAIQSGSVSPGVRLDEGDECVDIEVDSMDGRRYTVSVAKRVDEVSEPSASDGGPDVHYNLVLDAIGLDVTSDEQESLFAYYDPEEPAANWDGESEEQFDWFVSRRYDLEAGSVEVRRFVSGHRKYTKRVYGEDANEWDEHEFILWEAGG